jgi:integrase
MKRHQFIVKPYRSAARPDLRWQVVGYVNGKRTRRFVNEDGTPFTKAQADQYARLKNLELAQHGSEGTKLSTYDRVTAQRGVEELASYGLTIDDAIRDAVEKQKARQRSRAIEAVCDQYLESAVTRKLSHSHLLGLRRFFKRFCETFNGKLISDLTTLDLEKFLSCIGPQWSASSRNQHRTKLTGLWFYGEKHGYCSEKVARNIDWLKPKENVIGILSPAEIAAQMSAASPKIVVGMAIGAWAGLRVSEICLLDWRDIDLREKPDPKTGGYGFIRVLPANEKMASNRWVTILPNLAAWLRPFERSNGPVVTPNKTAGFDELRQIDQEKAGLAEWPNNALRHSYASYHYAHFKDLALLISEMGHTGPRQIFKHYREVVRPEDAPEYWQIAPFSRTDTTKIYAFTPEAYPWCRRVGSVVDGEWIDGVKNLAHYFGSDYALPYYWFNHVRDCPQRPVDDRFHIPTWREFVARHTEWKSNSHRCLPFYISWYCGDRSGERRTYFATVEEAVKFADAKNRELLGNEVRLDEIKNVIEFTTNSIAAHTFQSQPPHRTSEIAGSAG